MAASGFILNKDFNVSQATRMMDSSADCVSLQRMTENELQNSYGKAGLNVLGLNDFAKLRIYLRSMLESPQLINAIFLVYLFDM